MGPAQAAVAAARNTPGFVPLPRTAARMGYDSVLRLELVALLQGDHGVDGVARGSPGAPREGFPVTALRMPCRATAGFLNVP